MNNKNLNCHPERVEGSQPLHISSRDIVENAKLNHEIAKELRKYKRRHPEHCEGSSQNKKAMFHWILRAKALRMTSLLGTLFLLPSIAHAETCTPTPDCKSLGYTETSCPDGGGVKCPWNTSLMYCQKCKNTCISKSSCEIGDILFSDKKCYTCPNAYTLPGLQPIGVVFSSGKALALSDINGTMTWSNAKSACSSYSAGNINGWSLPSKDELLQIHNTINTVQTSLKKALGGRDIQSNKYWSSSGGYNYAYWTINPVSGDTYNYYSGNYNYYVRPILPF